MAKAKSNKAAKDARKKAKMADRKSISQLLKKIKASNPDQKMSRLKVIRAALTQYASK